MWSTEKPNADGWWQYRPADDGDIEPVRLLKTNEGWCVLFGKPRAFQRKLSDPYFDGKEWCRTGTRLP